jgi:hypothetical protein
MSPKVRLPLVELTSQTKAEVAAIMPDICDQYADYLIDNMCEPGHVGRRAVAG